MLDTQERLTTIRLGGQLGKVFGKTHKFYVSSPAEAVRAMCSQIEGFAAYLNDPNRLTKYKVFVADKVINPDEQLHELCGSKEIKIVPIISGSKKNGMVQAILGAALIVASFYTGGLTSYIGASAASAVGSAAFSVGVSLALGGIAQMLSSQPKLNTQEAPNNTPNTSLGIVNTSAQGRPVPMVYGEAVVGSAVISAGIYSSDLNY